MQVITNLPTVRREFGLLNITQHPVKHTVRFPIINKLMNKQLSDLRRRRIDSILVPWEMDWCLVIRMPHLQYQDAIAFINKSTLHLM